MQNSATRMDKSYFSASKLEQQGNADYQYWFDKSVEERLAAAVIMISVAFREPDFMKKLVDRTVYMAGKQKV